MKTQENGTVATPPDLYERDETAWLELTSTLVAQGRWDEIDRDNLREYLTDMANRDKKEVKSRLIVLLMHLLKWEYQPERRTTSWRLTVEEQLDELRDDLAAGSLRNHAEAVLPEAYARARKKAAGETELPLATFPVDCPVTIDVIADAAAKELLGPDFDVPDDTPKTQG